MTFIITKCEEKVNELYIKPLMHSLIPLIPNEIRKEILKNNIRFLFIQPEKQTMGFVYMIEGFVEEKIDYFIILTETFFNQLKQGHIDECKYTLLHELMHVYLQHNMLNIDSLKEIKEMENQANILTEKILLSK